VIKGLRHLRGAFFIAARKRLIPMSNKLDNQLTKDFEWLVSTWVGKNYKSGLLWKSKLRWALLKDWNNPRFNIGMLRDVRDSLGEQEASRLFQDTSDKIIKDQNLLYKAVTDYRKFNPLSK
jgi:hypothetical protein